jgi:hypothetical protein
MEPARRHPAPDGARAETQLAQLAQRDDPALTCGEARDRQLAAPRRDRQLAEGWTGFRPACRRFVVHPASIAGGESANKE